MFSNESWDWRFCHQAKHWFVDQEKTPEKRDQANKHWDVSGRGPDPYDLA